MDEKYCLVNILEASEDKIFLSSHNRFTFYTKTSTKFYFFLFF